MGLVIENVIVSKFLWHVPSVNGNLRGSAESFPTASDVPLVEREVKSLLLPDFNTLIGADAGRQADCGPSCWDGVCGGGQGLRAAVEGATRGPAVAEPAQH